MSEKQFSPDTRITRVSNDPDNGYIRISGLVDDSSELLITVKDAKLAGLDLDSLEETKPTLLEFEDNCDEEIKKPDKYGDLSYEEINDVRSFAEKLKTKFNFKKGSGFWIVKINANTTVVVERASWTLQNTIYALQVNYNKSSNPSKNRYGYYLIDNYPSETLFKDGPFCRDLCIRDKFFVESSSTRPPVLTDIPGYKPKR